VGVQFLSILDIWIKGKMKILEQLWAGRASAEANQHGLTTLAQKGGHKQKEVEKKASIVSSPIF
jgi:hypothetical protein